MSGTRQIALVLCILFPFACSSPEGSDVPSITDSVQKLADCSLTVSGGAGSFVQPMSLLEDGWYEASFSVTGGQRVLLVFSANQNALCFLWAGSGQNLTVWPSPAGGQRPFPVAFTPSVDGICTVRFHPRTLAYAISPAGQVTDENKRTQYSLLTTSTPPGSLDPSLPENRMTRVDGDTWQIVLTNLLPGRRVDLAFAANLFPAELLLKASSSSTNRILDAGLPGGGPGRDSLWLTYLPRSEEAVITLHPSIPSWSLAASSSPLYGDGYDDPAYGVQRSISTNPSWSLRSLAARKTPLAWYFLLDASFSAAGATIGGERGIGCVLALDDPAVSTGLSGTISMGNGLTPVALPPGVTVEYLAAIRSVSPSATGEGVQAVSLTLYGPLVEGQPFPAQGRSITGLGSVSQDGYLAYGNRYEIVIPRYSASGVPLIPSGALRITAFAWNAGTAWGDPANTNFQYPIAEAIPWGSSNSSLAESASWLLVP